MSVENEHIELLAEVRSGDRASLNRLAALVWDRLYPFAFRTTLNHDVTEDVLQETLVSLLCGVDSLRNPARFWPWMYRIAWNKIRDRHRQRRLEASAEGRLLREAPRPDATGSVLDAKVREETLAQVARAVAHLSREHQDVVRLRYYDQLPYNDIAFLTRTTPQKVRVQFHRAKESLKTRLQMCGT
ncbi:MAG: RNA polymerase sigma factor [Sedimentisphaerales bacterium]|nr:RNA polymerase sigma factor [Sedimentisphaerales bacterium]